MGRNCDYKKDNSNNGDQKYNQNQVQLKPKQQYNEDEQQRQPQQQAQYQPSPTNRPPPRKKKSKKKIMAVIGVIAIIVIAAVLSYFLFSNKNNVQETPESTLDEYVERVNDKDGEGSLELLILGLIEDKSLEDRKETYKSYIDGGNLSYYDYEIKNKTYEEDMSSQNKTILDSIKDELKNDYDIDVEDCCILEVEFTEESDGEDYISMDELLFMKVDGKWYLREGYY